MPPVQVQLGAFGLLIRSVDHRVVIGAADSARTRDASDAVHFLCADARCDVRTEAATAASVSVS